MLSHAATKQRPRNAGRCISILHRQGTEYGIGIRWTLWAILCGRVSSALLQRLWEITTRLENPRFEQKLVMEETVKAFSSRWLISILRTCIQYFEIAVHYSPMRRYMMNMSAFVYNYTPWYQCLSSFQCGYMCFYLLSAPCGVRLRPRSRSVVPQNHTHVFCVLLFAFFASGRVHEPE